MSVTLIIILILLGIVLFLIEFLLVPGITVAGIGGAILMISGVVLGYYFHGATTGNLILLGTALISVLTIYFVLKSRTWKKVMLDTKIDGKVNLLDRDSAKINVGDTGVTITRLNPIGKIKVNGEYYEAQAVNQLIDENTPVVVSKISGNKIIVELNN
jgi:membrane-bound ClpP family serine protease